MSAIAKSLGFGYGAQKVLDFILKKYPKLAPKIQTAQKFGYTIPQILSFLSSNNELNAEDIRGLSESETLGLSRKMADQRREQGAITAASLAPAISSLATPVAAIASQSPKLPIGPQPMANAPTTPPQIPPVPQGGAGQAAQAAPAVQPIPATHPGNLPQTAQQAIPSAKAPIPLPKVNSAEIIKEMGLENTIRSLAQAGNDPDQIAAGIEIGLTPGQKKWLEGKIKSGEAQPIPALVKDYLTTQATSKQSLSVENPSAPKKGDTALDIKSGALGEIEDIKKKQALIKEDGRLKPIDITEGNLAFSPLAKKDLADLFDELNSAIEKESGEDVSRSVRFVGYNPKENLLLYIPWNGSPYLYDEISPEDGQFLMNTLQQRRTTGESLIGVWEEGTKSVFGSKMFDFIQKLQKERGGKGNEYLAKFEALYDPHAHAIKAKSEKKKRQDRERKAAGRSSADIEG